MPGSALFTADVAVKDQNEIAQDSPPVCSHIAKERLAGGWVFASTNTTAPAVGLSRLPPPKKRPKLHHTIYSVWYNLVVSYGMIIPYIVYGIIWLFLTA